MLLNVPSRNTCRGLFEVHKLLFSAHICARVLASANKLNQTEFQFLLNGSVVLDRRDQMLNPCPEWIGDISWDDLCELDKLPGFHGLTDSIEKAPKEWHAWYTTNDPEHLPLVGEWQDICTEFQRMLIVRCLRPDRITSCMRSFVTGVLGARFVEPPVLDVKAVLEESTCRTPLIFVLSPGVDPTASLMQLAEASKMAKKFQCLSLGQGQAPIAKKMIQDGRRTGHWVYLANCHLSLSWMPELDKLVDELQAKRPHSNFRLWLSSDPTPDFPIAILQAGIKMTTEPPKGLRANLKRIYTNLSEDQFELCKERDKYRKLLFSLCFFHSVLLERKKFQQLGFNVAYSFNDADFEVSENLLALYLDEYPETPWDALRYLIAAVNYGGHVTDDWDRRVLTTYINQYFCEAALVQAQFKLSTLSSYFIPRDGNLESYLDYVHLLPSIDQPEAFGQHPNADIAASIAYARFMFEKLLSMQMQTGGEADGGSAEEKVACFFYFFLFFIRAPLFSTKTLHISRITLTDGSTTTTCTPYKCHSTQTPQIPSTHSAGHPAGRRHLHENPALHQLREHRQADRGAPDAAGRRPAAGDRTLQHAADAHAHRPVRPAARPARPRRHEPGAGGDLRRHAGGARAQGLAGVVRVAEAARLVGARPGAARRALCPLGGHHPSAGAVLAGGVHLPDRLPDGRAADGGAPQRGAHRPADVGVCGVDGRHDGAGRPAGHRCGVAAAGHRRRVRARAVPGGRGLESGGAVPARAAAHGAGVHDAGGALPAGGRGAQAVEQEVLRVPVLLFAAAQRCVRDCGGLECGCGGQRFLGEAWVGAAAELGELMRGEGGGASETETCFFVRCNKP